MDFKGRYSIPAPPEAVFAALHDPAILKASIPGCESVEQVSPQQFTARAVLKIGPVKATFSGKVTLTPETAPQGFTHAVKLSGEGQGGAAGFARGQSEVRLAAENGGTVLTYDAKAVVGGRLAQVGQRLIDSAAKSVADDFFAKFTQEMKDKHPTSVFTAPSSSGPPEPAHTEGLSPQIWVVGLIGIIVILLIVFSIVL